MSKPYFIRVTEQSPTMFWINNPTRAQADLALQHGALGCTNNPSYTQKMIDHPEEGPYALAILDDILRREPNDRRAAVLFQAELVKPIAAKFLPLFESSGGQHGYVSIQGDPIDDEDVHLIIEESIENRAVAPNICCKIPTTAAGIAAMEDLVPRNVPLNATEIFGVSQMVSICETYERLARRSGSWPMIYMSHIAGIYDDFFKNYVQANDVQISRDVLQQAGLAVARRVYNLMMERGYHAVFIAGGARGLHHFTEMVGGRVCITINWEGTADQLIAQDPAVIYRLFNPVPPKVIDELLEKLPDFKRGWLEDGLTEAEYNDYGPVQLFRSSFMKSWLRVLDVIKERRAAL
jgi:transaldolase